MNTSLLAGLGAGTGLVAVGLVGASVLFPPASRDQVQVAPEIVEDVVRDSDPARAPEATHEDADVSRVEASPELAAEPSAPEPSTDPDPALTEQTADRGSDAEPLPDTDAEETVLSAPITASENPVEPDALADDLPPLAPAGERDMAEARLPSGLLPMPRTEGGLPLPQVSPPPAPETAPADPATSDAPDADASDRVAMDQNDSAMLPGTRGSSLPQIGAGDLAPPAAGSVPDPGQAAISALERNSLYAGGTIGPKMAIVLNDPGLPMALRRSLAAMNFPFTVALNPLDTSAPEAAELYNDAGKEVLILATSIPEGATASDLDVSFNTFFANLPTAVGVIDLPETGFGRNARLLGEVLPLLRQDGHGLVTFAGGLAQAARAAAAAGVPQTEVFRVLDSGNDSAFTIRRFLDRAVFQASQIGEVIVYGDAANDVTMEAIEMWRDGSRLDQINLVPISGILLDRQ